MKCELAVTSLLTKWYLIFLDMVTLDITWLYGPHHHYTHTQADAHTHTQMYSKARTPILFLGWCQLSGPSRRVMSEAIDRDCAGQATARTSLVKALMIISHFTLPLDSKLSLCCLYHEIYFSDLKKPPKQNIKNLKPFIHIYTLSVWDYVRLFVLEIPCRLN